MRGGRSLLRRSDYTVALIALLLYIAGRAPFLGQWDSFDYLKQTVTHRLSDLAFGRPVFIGYNIALWETCRWLFDLRPLQVEGIMMAAAIAMGVAGVLLFARLARQMLPSEAARMATLSFALAPLYAVYTGYIMTEVPMLVAALGCATLLWQNRQDGRFARDIAAGILFGLAVGIREQALTLAPAFCWIVWVRRTGTDRMLSLLRFGAVAAAVGAGPVLALYLYDPVAFLGRMQVWLRAIPTGQVHFGRNVQANVLYTLGMAPALWLGLLGAALSRYSGKLNPRVQAPPRSISRGAEAVGVFLCFVVPLVVLWRDADVQLHPRYSLIALPAAVIICVSAYHRWCRGRRAVFAWAVLQVAVFWLAQTVIAPFREMQSEKMRFARSVRLTVPRSGLIAAGSYSPILDYYRAVGDRPEWHILWSGWGWKKNVVANTVWRAWRVHKPVFLCDGPLAWFYFEDQRLDLFYIFRGHAAEQVAPGLLKISPMEVADREPGILSSPQRVAP